MPRTLVAIVLLVLGLLGLFMAACGGLFTIGGVMDSIAGGQKGSYASGMLTISVPSLIAGVLLLGFVKRKYGSWRAGSVAAQFERPHDPQ